MLRLVYADESIGPRLRGQPGPRHAHGSAGKVDGDRGVAAVGPRNATIGLELYRAWLEEAGFAEVRQLSERRLAAVK